MCDTMSDACEVLVAQGKDASPAAPAPPPVGKKAKSAAKAAAAAQRSSAEAAAASEARCTDDSADVAQEMLLAVVEGHPQRLYDTMQLLLKTARSSSREVVPLFQSKTWVTHIYTVRVTALVVLPRPGTCGQVF